jgi:hypothetical protein
MRSDVAPGGSGRTAGNSEVIHMSGKLPNRRSDLGGNNWRSRGEVGAHFPATGTPQNDTLSQSLFLARSGQAGRRNSGKSARLSRTAIQALDESERWIPAFAGMTTFRVRVPGIVIPVQAGIHFPV